MTPNAGGKDVSQGRDPSRVLVLYSSKPSSKCLNSSRKKTFVRISVEINVLSLLLVHACALIL